jgi:sirohydrochlorin ferrochelatase
MRPARVVTVALVLTAHGSADPRSAAVTHAVAGQVRRLRPWLDVRVAFLDHTAPRLDEVLAQTPDGIVVPFLLADAYHARTDIPAMIRDSGAQVRQSGVLGEDSRLVRVLRERIGEAGFSRLDPDLGVIVTAVGSTRPDANARTAHVAGALEAGTHWTAAVAFATGPRPTLTETAGRLRRCGATRLVIAPWFLAHGRITDRVAEFGRVAGVPMTDPLGAHPLVAETLLDRYDTAVAARAAA